MHHPPRRLALALLAATLAAGASCGARTGLDVPDDATRTCTGAACACGATAFVGAVARSAVDRIDLLLAVDNSSSMADKQQILALAIPDLVAGLVNPRCLDDVTDQPVADQPSGPLDPCPAGSTRDFTPVLDIHIGMVSSSLGTFGADGCPDPTPATACGLGATNNDHGHLVTRSDPCGKQAPVPTYRSQGFLAWDPAQALVPPGIADAPSLVSSVASIVTGDGELGCGFESQDESWYRFLVDPTPYESIKLVGQNVVTSGQDTTLLQQRADFLRPDSLLAILVVSDETDTSIKQSDYYPVFAQTTAAGNLYHLPHATAACTAPPPALGPLDPCCASCGQTTLPGCTPDPSCAPPNNVYTAATEAVNLRAFGLSGGLMSHKARYGIEFFYPPSRYVDALTSPTVANHDGAEVPNPLYTNLDPARYPGGARDPSLVFYAAIVGVPWQLIARQKNGVPDLINGVSALDPSQVGGFKTSRELALTDREGHTFWDDIAGDPENYVPPRSPFMQESTVPRRGTDPITGASVSPPSTPNGEGATAGGALLNDHERTIATPPGEIEYACVFPIVTPIDCTLPGSICDCTGEKDNPVCAPNPNDGMKPTLQVKAKAYPGVKELAIARGMGDQGIAASICAKQLDDPTADDYGYRPAVKALLDRLGQTLGEQCLTRALVPDEEGQVACSVLEARDTGSAPCTCDPAAARLPVPHADACYQDVALEDPRAKSARWNCFCEIAQTSGAPLHACQTDVGPTPGNGWCYIDPSTTPPTGNPALVKGCPDGDRRVLRFVGAGAPAPDSTIFIGCK